MSSLHHLYSDGFTRASDKVRFYIGDTHECSGPRPDGGNFSNAELDFVLSEESNRVNGAVARCFEILAAEWTAWAGSEREGTVVIDSSKIASEYRTQAAFWRQKPDGASLQEGSIGYILLSRSTYTKNEWIP